MGFPEQLKAAVRRKAHFCCCLCKSLGVEVHHVIPQEEGGPDTEDNAAPLCPSCHETYGANPQKRKFIREARDLWYDICAKRYAADPDQLAEIKKRLEQTVSFEAFEEFKEELFGRLASELDTPRNEEEIVAAVGELLDKVWYNRHLVLREKIADGSHRLIGPDEPIRPNVTRQDIWDGALSAARKVERKYGKRNLGPYSNFEWGMLNGKLSALRWVLGDDWDMLDT